MLALQEDWLVAFLLLGLFLAEWGYRSTEVNPTLRSWLQCLCVFSHPKHIKVNTRLGDNEDRQDYVVAVAGTVPGIRWALQDTVGVLHALGKK